MPVTSAGLLYSSSLYTSPEGNSGGVADMLINGSHVPAPNDSAAVAALDPASVVSDNNPVPPLTALGVIAVLLVVIGYFTRKEESGIDPAFLGVGVYNLVLVTLMAIVGIGTTKIILNKYPVKGLTQFVNI